MDLSTPDVVRDELIKTNTAFRDLVNQHQSFEARLNELAHLNYPNDDEQVEESTLKKKKLLVKDAIYEMMHDFEISHLDLIAACLELEFFEFDFLAADLDRVVSDEKTERPLLWLSLKIRSGREV